MSEINAQESAEDEIDGEISDSPKKGIFILFSFCKMKHQSSFLFACKQ